MTLTTDNPRSRVAIFIDLRNVFKSVEMMKTAGLHLDLFALAKQLNRGRELIAAYVFDSRRPFGMEDESRRLHDRLRYLGFRVMAREAYDPERDQQKEVDVAMACEMVVHGLRGNYDVAIVVSGDRDFVPAIQHVQAAGKQVEVAAFSSALSNEMKRTADRFHELDKMPLMIMNNPSDMLAPELTGDDEMSDDAGEGVSIDG